MDAMPLTKPDTAEPGRLASLLSLNEDAGNARWHPEGFAAIWRHQLSTKLSQELGGAEPVGPLRSTRMPIDLTVGQLLHHPCPPAELLDGLRNFAKSSTSGDGDLPRDVARVLYFATIAASLLRSTERSTSLDNVSLKRGFEWALLQVWVDAPIIDLMAQALSQISSGDASPR